MYMQNDISAATPTGPHFKEPEFDPSVRRAELDQVIASATSAIPKAAMRKLGKLSFAPAAEDDGYSYFGQIRSEPMGASGIEFRFPMPPRDTGRRDLGRVASELVQAATTIARVSRKLEKYAGMIRSMAEEAIAPAIGGIASIRVVGIASRRSCRGSPCERRSTSRRLVPT